MLWMVDAVNVHAGNLIDFFNLLKYHIHRSSWFGVFPVFTSMSDLLCTTVRLLTAQTQILKHQFM